MRILIENGADINAVNLFNDTALSLAIASGKHCKNLKNIWHFRHFPIFYYFKVSCIEAGILHSICISHYCGKVVEHDHLSNMR